MVNTAVILAAGIGSRLKELGGGKPKGFIQIEQFTLISRSIQLLKKHGISKIIIVTGYQAESYQELARHYSDIQLIYSDRFSESGSMYSLSLVRNVVKDDFLLLESDLIYEEMALVEIQKIQKPNGILMSHFTQSGDEVYVSTKGERIVWMSKKRNELENVTGELVGISKISRSLLKKMLIFADNQFKTTLDLHYEDCLNEVAIKTPIYYLKVDDLIWAEIDTFEHLNWVLRVIWPQLLAKEGTIKA